MIHGKHGQKETEFQGTIFRTRLDARFAVLFDALHEPWEYRSHTFETRKGPFLVEFRLPRLQLWLKVKSKAITQLDSDLGEEFGNDTGQPLAIAGGLPGVAVKDRAKPHGHWLISSYLNVFCMSMTDGGGGNIWTEDCFLALDDIGRLCICSNLDSYERNFSFPDWDNQRTWPAMKLIRHISRPIPMSAVYAANSKSWS